MLANWTGLDLTKAHVVEVVWDATSRRLWINTEEGCVGRIYNVGEFHYRETPIVSKE